MINLLPFSVGIVKLVFLMWVLLRIRRPQETREHIRSSLAVVSLVVSNHHLVRESSPMRFDLAAVQCLTLILHSAILTVEIKIVKMPRLQSLRRE